MKNLTKKQIKEKDDHARNLSAALDWLREINGAQQDYVSERSEAWQGSDKAEAYNEWAESFEACAESLETAFDELEALEVAPE